MNNLLVYICIIAPKSAILEKKSFLILFKPLNLDYRYFIFYFIYKQAVVTM